MEPGLGDGGLGGVVEAEVEAVFGRRLQITVLAMNGVIAGSLGVLVRVVALYHEGMTG